MSEDPKHETGYLGDSEAQPMEDRPVRPDTQLLGQNWQLQVKIDDKKVTVPVSDSMLIGRSVEGDDPSIYALDLGTYSGYQSGVSRKHATISFHDGALYIEDHGSTNGTRINGFQLTARRKYRLRDGDEVEFARLRTVFRFVRP